jgi:hypothetical protein
LASAASTFALISGVYFVSPALLLSLRIQLLSTKTPLLLGQLSARAMPISG